MKLHGILTAAWALTLFAGAAQAAELRLAVHGLVADTGKVYVALYDSEEAYSEREGYVAVRRAGVEGRSMRFVFSDLSPGTYAVTVFQDLNGNGRLDRRSFGRPSEPYGFSRDARGRFGPPSWQQAALKVSEAGLKAVITLEDPNR